MERRSRPAPARRHSHRLQDLRSGRELPSPVYARGKGQGWGLVSLLTICYTRRRLVLGVAGCGAASTPDATPTDVVVEVVITTPTPLPAPQMDLTTSTNGQDLAQWSARCDQNTAGKPLTERKFEFSAEDPADDIHYGDPLVLDGKEYPQRRASSLVWASAGLSSGFRWE